MKHSKIVVIYILAIVALMLVCACRYAANADARNEVAWVEHVVRPGDTLWKLAVKHCPPKRDLREWIYLMRQENGIGDPGSLRIGQMIKVPVVGK